jgi:hypothetical protein
MAEEDSTATGTTDDGTTTPDEGATEPDAATLKAELEKWKGLSRKHEGRAKANEAAELERLTDQAKTNAQRADEAEARATRYEVALEKKVPANLMKFLAGSSREDIEASADELLEALGTTTPGTGEAGATGGKPKERMRPGAANDDDPVETDPRKLAALIPRGGNQ